MEQTRTFELAVRRRCALLLVALACAAFGFVPSPGSAAPSSRVVVPRLSTPPRLTDFLEPGLGEGSGSVASEMVVIEGFKTRSPRDGEPVSERTLVYLGYDDKRLYAAFLCFDSRPEGIRSQLLGRDRILDSDDSVALQLDTFRDLKHAYAFQVNPAGVQQDAFWTEGKGWDLSFDAVWRSEARQTSFGYVVLISVPFKSLRFPDAGSQQWGLLLFRGIARKNENAFWPSYSTKISGRMNQAGVLAGLDSLPVGGNASITPSLSARSFRVLDVDSPQGPRFVSDDSDLEIGVDAKLVIGGALTLDATANPDFSQVESDEPQVTVNRRFETFFPERRPFFVENASYFDTPIPLLFTRRILQPGVGARLSGRVGAYTLGALGVGDRPDGLPGADVGVLRLNRDVGEQSSVGLFLSHRDDEAQVNRVAGLDTRFKLAPKWVGSVQAASSYTRDSATPASWGSAYSGTIDRAGEKFTYGLISRFVDPDFRSTLGFVERRDILSLEQSFAYKERPSRSAILAWGPELTVSEVRDHRNRRLDRLVTPGFGFEWPAQTRLRIFHRDARVTLRPAEVPSVLEALVLDHAQWGAEFATSPGRRIALDLGGIVGSTINLAPVEGKVPELVDSRELSLSTTLRPTKRLEITGRYFWTRLEDRSTGSRVLLDQIARIKANYQFTATLSVRAIVQYDSLDVDPNATALERRENLNTDLLFTWRRSPWTALYVGYNHNQANIDPSLMSTSAGLLRTSDRLLTDGSQLFVKISYHLQGDPGRLWRRGAVQGRE